ncbi:MAG: PDZ domain-containing protein [Nitrospirae bacterium]|nr:PDZ domain-containing protein [Magnetococcales bacterium]HAT51473.1 hypothetical protein [Alphaproteobacteria bacterium]
MRRLVMVLMGFWTVLFASGCGGGGSTYSGQKTTENSEQTATSSTGTWTTAAKNEFVLRQMREWYLWYDQIPASLNADDYASPEAVLEAARYTARDRWSYIESAQTVTAHLSTGEFTGIGIRTSQDAEARLWINQIFPGSPAKAANIVRGDQILRINGRTIAEINAENSWDTAFGEDAAGTLVTLVIQHQDTTQTSYSLSKSTFIVDAVSTTKVLQQGSVKIAYLVYDTFTSSSRSSLNQAFETFKNAGVTEMVLDLRYNGGGYIDIAAYLASLIRDASDKEIFATLRYNKNHSDSNYSLTYTRLSTDLNLSRVFVITAKGTCSASEMVIQGLKPYVTVVTIGSTTCGKPVGMDLVSFDDQVLAAISFEIANANGEAEYYDGIAPTCPANDDLTNPLGESAESSLATALAFLSQGSCPTTTQRRLPPKILTLWPRKHPDQGDDGMW